MTDVAAAQLRRILAIIPELADDRPHSVAEIAERLGIPSSTLSFHVKTLVHAGLIESRQDGRFIHYSADFDAMNGLVAFLGENCCGGRSCAPSTAPPRAMRVRHG